MFESFGFENLTAPQAAIWFAALIGLGFGVLAQITKFCFRRALIGDDRRAAAGVWLTALATAVLGTQAAAAYGLISFDDHRFMASDMPVLAIVSGGLLFGVGMVLTRGCVSRLTVLSASGNLRAMTVLIVFAITAHATLKGVLAPIRTTLGSVTIPFDPNLASLGNSWVWAALIAGAALFYALRSGAGRSGLALAALLGLLAPLGWVGTGFILYDDFDPIALQSLSFTSPYAETLFWSVASTSIPAGFGVGLIGGVLAGAWIAALIRRELTWQSFESPAQTGRYLFGAILMGLGGVLAGGCTVGAGLSGIPTLSVAAIIAIIAIAIGAVATNTVLNRQTGRVSGAPSNTPPLQPAE